MKETSKPLIISEVLRLSDFEEYRPAVNWPKGEERGICVAAASNVDVVYRPDSIDIDVHENHQKYWRKTYKGHWQRKDWQDVVKAFEQMDWQLVFIARRVEWGIASGF